MASSNAHHSTGIAAGLIAAALVFHAGASGPYHIWSILAVVAGISGGTAPDWLEVAWWSRKRKLWITHRTWTHWGIAWVVLLAYSYFSLNKSVYAPVAFGFAAGGIMHLLADWPNPLGVPWIIGRHSLNLWKSGRCDMIVEFLAWSAAFVIVDAVYFGNEYTCKFISLVMPACLTSMHF
ncbi:MULTISPECIES: metal-dependent hydrolase [unclassified Massilia]|uniref:metal-dependent hydrolase n=1 Tax=unclassified Massilia TaxID=2609279 RepID=UPI00177CDE7B|nr:MULTISPECIES: metal-dependent hydrolase [unclassified Massilia]MBD8531011.1 metal-dependent hydrolase [Massilia sp. CFBP 13647]MBD8674711.1 metal-dependent hydrolase [Massilia sp. CFBP 13721]